MVDCFKAALGIILLHDVPIFGCTGSGHTGKKRQSTSGAVTGITDTDSVGCSDTQVLLAAANVHEVVGMV